MKPVKYPFCVELDKSRKEDLNNDEIHRFLNGLEYVTYWDDLHVIVLQ